VQEQAGNLEENRSWEGEIEGERERERQAGTGCYVQHCFVTRDRGTDRLGARLAFVGRSLL
jgi:hypothetical protein